ncbi:hypothetical protein C8J56DRAFT_1064070 [Mycena floridula]|nr:hypothetical protein C8J56DRAFT_1064070 [Mycena floridula]
MVRPPALAENDEQSEIALLKAKLALAQEELQKAKDQPPKEKPAKESIQQIPRPKGEGGDGKRGFKLITVMGLDEELEKDRSLYKAMLAAVKTHAMNCQLDPNVEYRYRPSDKLAKVFRMGRAKFSYLTQERFYADWAQVEMLKQATRNKHKYQKR